MKPERKLKLVKPEVVDITLLLRADIASRDWPRCHVSGDRSRPVEIADKPKWWTGFRK